MLRLLALTALAACAVALNTYKDAPVGNVGLPAPNGKAVCENGIWSEEPLELLNNGERNPHVRESPEATPARSPPLLLSEYSRNKCAGAMLEEAALLEVVIHLH